MYLLFQHALSGEIAGRPGCLVVYNRHDSGTDGLRFFKERVGVPRRRRWNGSRSPGRQARRALGRGPRLPRLPVGEGGDGLCLFAARFYGVNDAIHMGRNEMDLTLVDTSERVIEMADIYGSARPYPGDAWEFAITAGEHGYSGTPSVATRSRVTR